MNKTIKSLFISTLFFISVSASANTEYTKITVEKGDTLQRISAKHYGTTKLWKKIFSINKKVMKSENVLQVGMTLEIPTDVIGATTTTAAAVALTPTVEKEIVSSNDTASSGIRKKSSHKINQKVFDAIVPEESMEQSTEKALTIEVKESQKSVVVSSVEISITRYNEPIF